MFTYKKFWEKCAQKGISKTKLMKHYKLGHETVERLKADDSITMDTIQKLCNILDCSIAEIVECYPDEESSEKT